MPSTLLTNLVAYYKLSDVNDSVGGFNLTNNNTVAFNTGKIGNAGDGGATNTNKSLSIANDLGIQGGNCSISLWGNVTTAPGTNVSAWFVVQIDEGIDVDYEIIYRDVSGQKRLTFNRKQENVANNFIDEVVTLTLGTWYHIVLTYDGTNLRGYRDNSLVAGPTAMSGNGSGASGEVFRILANYAGADGFFSGLVDECGVWSKALSTAEISELYNNGAGNQWPFAGTTVTAGRFAANLGTLKTG